jgi:hypothetical protein
MCFSYYQVTAGMPLNFLQELVVINPSNQKFYLLGEVSHRMIVSASVPSLLEALDDHHTRNSTCSQTSEHSQSNIK